MSPRPPHDLMQTSAFPQRAPDIDFRVPVHDNRRLLSTITLYRAKYPEGKYEAVFGFVQGVYASEGAVTIINVWGEPEVFMRRTWKVLVDGKWEGVQSLVVEEDAEKAS
ncbi:hypothetical protein EDD85DRAFT_2942 [Armillaria nabsnona]|nr:hypothetical protein EDD85DRAFT_2942 [Armillaria nabsnona]